MGAGLSSDWRVGLVEVFLFGATVWRISSLLVFEEGPCHVFERMRKWIGVRYDEHSDRYGTNVIAEAFLCVWCLSVWVAGLLVTSWVLLPLPTSLLMLICTASTTAIVIERMVRSDAG